VAGTWTESSPPRAAGLRRPTSVTKSGTSPQAQLEDPRDRWSASARPPQWRCARATAQESVDVDAFIARTVEHACREDGHSKVEEKVRVNGQIRAREVRVIDDKGEQLGVMLSADAIKLALSKDLDLVEVAAAANPPVCRIMDYGKFRYQQKKKAQESRKRSTATILKEVKVGSMTSVHDVDFKMGHIKSFLAEGHRVKVSVFFRGRSITHPELGRKMLDNIAEKLKDMASVEQHPRLEGRSMSMMLIAK
jgi:translation initiation factor IF-3